jgi:hypothetical protein
MTWKVNQRYLAFSDRPKGRKRPSFRGSDNTDVVSGKVSGKRRRCHQLPQFRFA